MTVNDTSMLGTVPGYEESSMDRLRVAIVCDFLEEEWPSMNLVADLLTESLQSESSPELDVTKLRPPLRWRLDRLPILGNRRITKNCDRLMNRFRDYPRWLESQADKFDLFHLVDHSYAQLLHRLPPGRTVVTCHDLDTFRCVLEPERDVRPRWFRAMAARILDGFRQAAHVIAVSQATREELLKYGLLPADRISVVPNGVPNCYSPLPDPGADLAAERLLGERKNQILLMSIGNTLPRKRLDVLLRVFAGIRRESPDALLLRVGGFNAAQTELIREFNLEPAIVNLPFLEREIVAAVYRRATLLLHTAEAEGFGLPVVEAQACGCPVLASDLQVLREVGGPAASYLPVADVPAWQTRIMELLNERSERKSAWESRRQQGIAWTRRFSWAENARQTTRIYREMMGAFAGPVRRPAHSTSAR